MTRFPSGLIIFIRNSKAIPKEAWAMEFYNAVNARRSVRDFTDEKIPEKTLIRIIEAAYKAPAA